MERFKVREEAGILHVRFMGEAYFQNFEEYLIHISGISLPEQLKILHDNRDSVPQLKPSKIIELANLFEQYLTKHPKVKIAYIHNDPIGVALAQLFKSQLNGNQFKIEVFSGEEAAMKWLSAS
ncbi:MAG TPA: hypothetical protein VKA27_13400 [Sunxiuqinia sp.]|nr:hypothetical protein [Sunxiuqinia sp.]